MSGTPLHQRMTVRQRNDCYEFLLECHKHALNTHETMREQYRKFKHPMLANNAKHWRKAAGIIRWQASLLGKTMPRETRPEKYSNAQ